MILQALTEYYETLAARGELARPGWSSSNISYVLYINDAGELEQAVSVKTEQPRGKKTVMLPQAMLLPAPAKRTSGVASNFLWDNSSYIFGADNKGKPQRSMECFEACRKRHHALLDHTDCPAARALLAFFDHWEPERAAEHPALRENWDDMIAGSNFVFRYQDMFVQDDPLVRQAWQKHYDGSSEESGDMVCLVTGQKGSPEATHPAIKGVKGAQSSGAALVSFNAPALCSYGREQNLNAPVSKYAAFAYTEALNHLLADREHVFHIGDATVLFWCREGQPDYQDFLGDFMFGNSESESSNDLFQMAKQIFSGQPVVYHETELRSDMDFYILGLSPNAARLSVRFFLHNTFGNFLKNVLAHYERLRIVRPAYEPKSEIPLWKLLNETVNQKSRDKTPAPNMAGETLRAVLTDTYYPATLRNGVTMRIRAERKVTYGRAAILKAYYLKNPHKDVPKEVLTVSLNPDHSENTTTITNIPFNLGRLFALYEEIQSAVNPNLNTTIRDKYFNSAAATPASVFPRLVNLSQAHLKKLRKPKTMGAYVSYERQVREFMEPVGKTFPTRLSLPEQGSFQLGYYHQTQMRYQKKEEK